MDMNSQRQSLASFIFTCAQKIWVAEQTHLSPPPHLMVAIHRVVRMTWITPSIAILALHYLSQAKSSLNHMKTQMHLPLVMVSCLRLACKVQYDCPPHHTVWAKHTAYSLSVLNTTERMLLQGLDYFTGLSDDRFQAWSKYLLLLSKGKRQTTASIVFPPTSWKSTQFALQSKFASFTPFNKYNRRSLTSMLSWKMAGN
jgi:hypothetical protein